MRKLQVTQQGAAHFAPGHLLRRTVPAETLPYHYVPAKIRLLLQATILQIPHRSERFAPMPGMQITRSHNRTCLRLPGCAHFPHPLKPVDGPAWRGGLPEHPQGVRVPSSSRGTPAETTTGTSPRPS